MQREIIQTYADIMERLAVLPDQIAAVQTDLNAAKMQLSANGTNGAGHMTAADAVDLGL